LTILYRISYTLNINNETTEYYKGGIELASVYGKLNLSVIVPVNAESETMGLLEANYKLEPNRIIGYELVAVDCKGERHKIDVCDCSEVLLNEYLD
jgi:hypothetical protein